MAQGKRERVAKCGQTKTALFQTGRPIDRLKGIVKSQAQASNFCMPMLDEMTSKVKVLKLLPIVME